MTPPAVARTRLERFRDIWSFGPSSGLVDRLSPMGRRTPFRWVGQRRIPERRFALRPAGRMHYSPAGERDGFLSLSSDLLD